MDPQYLMWIKTVIKAVMPASIIMAGIGLVICVSPEAQADAETTAPPPRTVPSGIGSQPQA
jgi:hypothetical protein